MPIQVRAAEREDVPALVRLRLTNAERHVQLDPAIYRVPDTEAVRGYFEDALAGESKGLILVAEAPGERPGETADEPAGEAPREIVGMVEIVPRAAPPDHQIVTPRRAADIHTVVLDGHRGKGVGAALVKAAEKVAVERGVVIIYAGIFAQNTGAVRFYSAGGFGPRGTLLSKQVGPPPTG